VAAAGTAQGELVKVKAMDRQRKAESRERKSQITGSSGRSATGTAAKPARASAAAKRVGRVGKQKG
jgi:hypothetical protein